MSDKNKDMAQRIAAAVSDAGGRTFYVGGYVRDQILGRENKDIDIEVHGIPVPELENILNSFGKSSKMGACFGIFGLQHYDIDIAMPLAEKAARQGYMNFEESVDPFIGYEKAAVRRDFTMNALMQDVLTDEILDFFGGISDIRHHRIQYVNAVTFSEDPLRVFRAAQFAARFDFEITEGTIELARTIDVTEISCERIMTELEKALLKSGRPSVFFRKLRKMDQLSAWFPELEALVGIPQDPAHHPEGYVWEHTMQVIDQAAMLRNRSAEPLAFMISAMCHDFGKAATSTVENGRVHAYGHETEALPIIERFLKRITLDKNLLRYVLNMTELHMQPNQKVRSGANKKSFMKMFDRSVCPEDLLLLAKADSLGRKSPDSDDLNADRRYEETEAVLQQMLSDYHELISQPYVMGKDLIEAGIKPGPLMGEGLAYAHKLRLAGVSKEHQLSQTLAFIQKSERDE